MLASFAFYVIFHKKRLSSNHTGREITTTMFTVDITRKLELSKFIFYYYNSLIIESQFFPGHFNVISDEIFFKCILTFDIAVIDITYRNDKLLLFSMDY